MMTLQGGVKVMALGVAQTRRWLQVAPELLLLLMAHCLLLGSALAAEVEARLVSTILDGGRPRWRPSWRSLIQLEGRLGAGLSS